MRISKLIGGIAVFSMLAVGCSSDSDTPAYTIPTATYAMTWKMNGVEFKRNNTWGRNTAISNLYTYYPDEDYIRLQGTGTFTNNDGVEIDIMIKKTDLVVGNTYQINRGTMYGNGTHIELLNISNDESEITREGSITITESNPIAKTVKGTFHFKTSDDADGIPYIVNYNVTDGTFSYRYDIVE
jgi:hypothetical protein